MVCRFQPYSNILRVGEETEGSNELFKALHIIFESELRNNFFSQLLIEYSNHDYTWKY